MSWFLPASILKRKDGLPFQLFSYLSAVIISIVLLQGVVEKALMTSMLKVPPAMKAEMRNLAEKAEMLVERGDMAQLANWANQQPYYLFVLDSSNQPLSNRKMHPHFEFKLRFLRELDGPLNDEVSQPLIGIPLKHGNVLVIQLPRQLHPAHQFLIYLAISKVVIVVIILVLFSVIIARKLKQPLDRLRAASHQLAKGNFNINVASEVKSNVREFNQLAQDFDEMTAEIHNLAQKQRQLIRDVSHELRTPLARQNLALHLLRKQTDSTHFHLLDRVEREVDQMETLVTEILEFSRLENARYEAQFVMVDLQESVKQQLPLCALPKGDKQSITFHGSDHVPQILVDERLLQRVLQNLISNAIKYAGEAAQIDVSIRQIENQGQKWLLLEISDNGSGIDEASLESVFNPFTRLESARDKQSGGYGLGLAIVKESMSIMNGAVSAANRQEGGLVITLHFPIA
ncbi:histidine kinase sensor domain-containing protein [Vibrio sp. NTOU-M3]|uniref:histidine kinase sensor domain-containing protein n=1 Tax=Vibrio sp. NTOU-M3 TaxID=3234954 RepID=UPI00349FAF4E